MALQKLSALVLHTIPYRETSIIARVLTAEYGVISVVAKGAKRKKSVTGVHFSFCNTLNLEVYYSDSRELHTLKESAIITQRSALSEKMISSAVAQVMMEIVLQCNHGKLGAEELFELLSRGLDFLTEQPELSVERSYLILCRYLVHVSRIYGFEINTEYCIECMHLLRDPVHFSIERGGCICNACAEHSTEKSRALAVAICHVGSSKRQGGYPKELILYLPRLEELLFTFLSLHSESMHLVKSYEYLKTVRAF
ncbi:MAG: DNA repair protein RecO [Fibrobacterales bacterium]